MEHGEKRVEKRRGSKKGQGEREKVKVQETRGKKKEQD